MTAVDSADTPRTIVYPGYGLPCSKCGRPTAEFAHLANGYNYAKHISEGLVWTCLLGVDDATVKRYLASKFTS